MTRIGRWDEQHPPTAAEVRALRRELLKRRLARIAAEAKGAQTRETPEQRERRERAVLARFVEEFERTGRI